MLTYYNTTDAKGNRRKMLAILNHVVWAKGKVDLNEMTDSRGFDLEWTHLNLVRGINSDGLPNIKTIELGSRIAGKEKSHEEEIAKARRWIPQFGKLYEIREYTRLTYYSNFYKWFGWVKEEKHVYFVAGEGCPFCTFALAEWGTQRPSDFEIINQAKATKRTLDDI